MLPRTEAQDKGPQTQKGPIVSGRPKGRVAKSLKMGARYE
jgi:hypothetical protein